jgi:hypothetical protein
LFRGDNNANTYIRLRPLQMSAIVNLEFGAKFPFDGSDIFWDGRAAASPAVDWKHAVARGILASVSTHPGIKQALVRDKWPEAERLALVAILSMVIDENYVGRESAMMVACAIVRHLCLFEAIEAQFSSMDRQCQEAMHGEIAQIVQQGFERFQVIVDEPVSVDRFYRKPDLASEGAALAASNFILKAKAAGACRPNLTLSNGSAVSVVWRSGGNSLSVSISGAEQFSAVGIADGEHKLAIEASATTLPEELVEYLLKYFGEPSKD